MHLFCLVRCSCDLQLPANPLEVRVTFSGNAESDFAVVLLLEVPGQLGGRREVVLRDWDQEVGVEDGWGEGEGARISLAPSR